MNAVLPPNPPVQPLPVADVQAPAGQQPAVYNQSFPVLQPEADRNDFMIQVRASALARWRGQLERIGANRFPWYEIALGISTTALGTFLGALPAQIAISTGRGVFYLIPMGPLLNQLNDSGRSAFFRSVGPELVPYSSTVSELAAMEDVVFIGYPSGLRDEKNATPLIRRGITSTPAWNDFEGLPTFLIDAGVFPGSSGSPVFILNQGAFATRSGLTIGNRLLFLGVITQTMLRTSPDGNVFLGLGKVVRSDAVREFIDDSTRSLS